jgi:methylated-DNA-[protein]-cysteine S-methyltransferase
MAVTHVAYEAEGWGVGELWLDAAGLLLEHDHPRPGIGPSRGSHPLAARFAAYFAGSRDDFADVELELDWCTPFEAELVSAARAIPYGETVTYGELAALAGRPRAPRAAGSFCARNRFALVVPCHRVVGASGLGGYGPLGLRYKRRLLELEGALG